MKQEPLIKAENIIPWDGHKTGLPGISIDIMEHGTTCLLGDDSELLADYLRALSGVDDIHAGKLELFGTSLQELNRHTWLQMRLKVGFVARTAPLLSVLSGLENVVLPTLYHKLLSREEAEATARILLTGLGCQADIDLLPAYLTSLERTQLAIARAAILKPAVLFLEEPYHELEVNEHNVINAFLSDWASTRALVLSTRNLHFVKQQADTIIFAAENKILYFDNWRTFNESSEPAVVEYLRQYRDNYSIE